MSQKDQLRHQAFARRKLTTPAERQAAGGKLPLMLPNDLLASSSFTELENHTLTVAAYVSMGTEIETRPLLGFLLHQNCRVLVPRLGSGRDIGWSVLSSLDQLQQTNVAAGNGARPDEPDTPLLNPQALAQADLVFAPALAVDPRGYRLGRGAGWYDRALAERNPGCPLIAICWPWEVLDFNLPAEPHDVPADAILTPTSFTWLHQPTPSALSSH
ncbi:5-formyltetrahydrofolate cyclo-ligase [Bifidobacterium oedipodis]|uniref:5-formyltetrahydrofolate cyclo-ligase n=1 Tax=Bifidobacterium oedipodis TaxID=2675322 RepID=A0A7Y0HTI6_9BIFI|nr:5-formyltetrahydrofolate cyclo-ligase [Bifidobacterium sp. DSM 109957]NMM94623.1 5-formyltetrahydrofolate cyclo-ligase [Bifidobacterium sp. DSM 109957]